MKHRTEMQLSETVQRQLNMYALAATAAGVGMLALAQPAEAKIVYTKANQQITANTQFHLDLNQDGTTDFTLSGFYHLGSTNTNRSNTSGGVLLNVPVGNFVRGNATFRGAIYASDLPAGVKLQGKKKFKNLNGYDATMAISSYVSGGRGSWRNVTKRYLGFKFLINGNNHYGWARLNVSCASFHCNGLLTGYAYETVANKAIVTGKTKGPDVVVLQAGTLGGLARGASGIRASREK